MWTQQAVSMSFLLNWLLSDTFVDKLDMPSWEISSFYCLVCFFPFFPELFRFCTVGDLPRVKELLEEASAVTINKLYQGGSTLLYKYVTKFCRTLPESKETPDN